MRFWRCGIWQLQAEAIFGHKHLNVSFVTDQRNSSFRLQRLIRLTNIPFRLSASYFPGFVSPNSQRSNFQSFNFNSCYLHSDNDCAHGFRGPHLPRRVAQPKQDEGSVCPSPAAAHDLCELPGRVSRPLVLVSNAGNKRKLGCTFFW